MVEGLVVGSSMAMEQVGRMPAVAQGRASSEAREPGLAMATSGPEPESALLGRCCGRQDQSYFFPDLLNLKKDLGKPISEVLGNFETSRIHNFVILGRYNRYGRYAGQSWARDSENATHRQPFFCLTTVVTLSRQCCRVPISLL